MKVMTAHNKTVRAIQIQRMGSISKRSTKKIADTWAIWSEILALPQLDEGAREPAPRRRRCNAIRARRPKFLTRRHAGVTRELAVHRGEREITARS